jgi:hypothetical protein
MANTIASALVVDVARDTVLTIAQNKLASLNAFSRDFSADALAPLKNVQVPKATAGATVQTDATNFESGDSTLTNIPVTVNQYSASFHLTNAQVQSGHRLSSLMEINFRQLANKILDVAFAPVTNANFGADAVDVAPASFDSDDLKTLWAAIEDSDVKNVILDGTNYAQILPTNLDSFNLNQNGAYGFDGIYNNNRWDGAGSNIVGLACGDGAIACASGVPVIDPSIANMMIDQELIEIPDLGITVQFCRWASISGREVWASFDVMFGASLGDANVGAVLGNGA